MIQATSTVAAEIEFISNLTFSWKTFTLHIYWDMVSGGDLFPSWDMVTIGDLLPSWDMVTGGDLFPS